MRDFYEQYPYPRPVESLDKYRIIWQDSQRLKADFYLFNPSGFYEEKQSILVAGCGTSQAAKYAVRYPKANVFGIDFSATSIECTEKLKHKYNLVNLTTLLLPVERAGELNMKFDRIACTGVLHHLPNPDEGLKALRNVLKPNGALHLMVYATYGRTGIYILQDFCRRLGIEANDNDIRNLILALRKLPPGHPLENLLREAPDFRNEAALADALLHPQDRAYTVPQLFDFIKNCGLIFGRWIKQAPYLPYCGALANIPQSLRITELPNEEQYAAAELFRGTMIRHSLIIYGDDNPNVNQTINFSNAEFLNYIPIRIPDTICVKERLPEGTAGVLINTTHTYKDIYLPINETEMQMLELIDGKCTISSIAVRILKSSKQQSDSDVVRSFFEKLWWYDQVVFDTSV